MMELELELSGLQSGAPEGAAEEYTLAKIEEAAPKWDKVVRSTHIAHCWYNRQCVFDLYIKDGVLLREELAASYPHPNDPEAPDVNPRGCQKGVCAALRTYDPSRLKYPLKRVGPRGAGRWQRLTWDQALSEIAQVLVDELATEGNDGVIACSRSAGGFTSSFAASALTRSLGVPGPNNLQEVGDEQPGAIPTWGKIWVCGSPDNWFYADMVFIWGCNPAYTQIANFHWIPEARYNGARVVAITPDYNASAPFADTWVPVKLGSDAALALAMAHVIIEEGLYRADFVREQTDLPLLVRTDNRKLLRQADLERRGADDVFYMFDRASNKVVEAPSRTLALDGVVPALEGEFEIKTSRGKVKVRPVFQMLREHLKGYTPEKAAAITGVGAGLIRRLAREFAAAERVVSVTAANWGKHYHGDLIQRAQILLWALCGQFGRKGAGYEAFPGIYLDSAVTSMFRRGIDAFLAAEGNDPRFAQWRQQGYTDEMIMYKYLQEAHLRGDYCDFQLLYYLHGGVIDIAKEHNSWDPHLKRSVGEYLQEALEKGWQVPVPPVGKRPSILLEWGTQTVRAGRTSEHLIRNIIENLKMYVVVDFRMGSAALYADYVLPAAGMYEKFAIHMQGLPQVPFVHLTQRAIDPVGEAKTEWEMFGLLAREIEEQAKRRGISSFMGRNGQEIRLDNLYDQVTGGGVYGLEDEEAIARDFYLNSTNVEQMEWEELKNTGIAPFTGLGTSFRDGACDVVPGEPIVPFTFHVEKKQPYPTLTRRMQFYIDHEWYLELGEALPTHKDIPPMGGNYPLQLSGGHARWSIHSQWKDNPLLLRLQRGVPIMFMSTKDASDRGIKDGDNVGVFNDVASIEIQAAVAPAVAPGMVVIYHDWENFQFKGKRHFKSLIPSPLNPIELVGDYEQLRPRGQGGGSTPGGSDRGTRVEVRKL